MRLWTKLPALLLLCTALSLTAGEIIEIPVTKEMRAKAAKIAKKNKVKPDEAQAQPLEYVKPDWVSHGVWEHLQPHLLPMDHPLKPTLDKIFRSARVTENKATFMGAGFLFHDRIGRRRVIARHPKMVGYLIKTYLDTHRTSVEDGLVWLNRIKGAKQFQDCIDRHGYNHLMKVPRKWLYPIPGRRSRSPYPKGYALIVEDANTLSHSANYQKYATEVTKEQLHAIYVMLTENKAFDCIHIFNIPFCKDGKIAFIDTEGLNMERPISFWKMTDKIPHHLRPYWENLYKGR